MERVPLFETRGESRCLVVLLHAYTSSPDQLKWVRRVVLGCKEYADADIFVPPFNAELFSREDPREIVGRLAVEIDQLWGARKSREDSPGYENIILIGHSLGALLARKLYVLACGENKQDTPFEMPFGGEKTREWAHRVSRIILLAGMNRGWRISHHLSLSQAIIWGIGVLIGNLIMMVGGRLPLIFAIRRGAPFLTQLRLQWLSMRQHADHKQAGNALVIQLLGSVDDMVSPEDNIDLVAGKDFIYLDVGLSGHANIIEMDDTQAGQERASRLRDALVDSQARLKARMVLPADMPLGPARLDVTDVVFVIHGIRDKGYWTHKIARRVKALGRENNRVFQTETSTYGYFAMLPFLMPWRRRAKVEWLMDQYAESKALYPNAKFSFVGHSNGTYLLAKAFEEYPSCRFRHVVFAGSVVRRKYDWERVLGVQVEAILNYVATADWVVAFFPKAFQWLKWVDLGSAGHDGFAQASPENKVYELGFVRGQHSAALTEENWDSIANFVVTGEPVRQPERLFRGGRSAWVEKPARAAALILTAILAFAMCIGYCIYRAELPEWGKTVAVIAYLWGIWKIITRV